MNFEPNQLIDNRYKIIKKLDEGGMGAVWKATDARTNDSIVVLKIPLKYRDPEILERFAREAGTMRELAGDCDNILDIQDIGNVAVNEIDNVPYYVMRFQTGGALRDWAAPKDDQGNPVLTSESLNWVTGVATALDFLHHQPDAVFHRDVKPENILFNASGTPKLSDFGIVKNIKKATTNITQTGAAMGTVAYMPPEIWRGGKFSPASDQFSFAATVYEMISGKRPYDGETPFAMLEALHKGHEKLEETIGLSPAASRALDRGLSHEPAERYESCGDFARVFLHGLSSEAAGPISGSNEGATGIHVGPIGPSSGGKIVGGKPIDPTTPDTGSPGSVGQRFNEPPIKPKPPEKPMPVASGGSLKPVLLGASALLLAGLVGVGVFLSGALSGSTTSNQPPVDRPGSSSTASVSTTSSTPDVARVLAEPESKAVELSWEEYKESPLSLVEQHAELGFAGAETELGFRASKASDYTTALKWYRKAEKKDYMRALSNLGYMYEQGKGVPQDSDKSFEYYQRAIDSDPTYTLAQNNLGVCYDKGQGVKEDDVEAVKWFRKAAEQGDAKAQSNLGIMYANGTGVSKDEKEAVKWYRRAAEQGSANAQHSLGLMYSNGTGVPKDEKEAVKWYRKAAEQGFANAQHSLGLMYSNGTGVPKDEKEAVKWYRKAAEQGFANAHHNLGLMYDLGTGVSKNEKEAVKWYRKAADQDHASAQFNLGNMYGKGRGVSQSYEEANSWYRKAAAKGNVNAQFNLGHNYQYGKGVKVDKKEAIRWFRKAAAQGDKEAKSRAEYLE